MPRRPIVKALATQGLERSLFVAVTDQLAAKTITVKTGTLVRPARPADLAKAGLIGFDDTARFSEYLRGIGIPIDAGDVRLSSDSSVAAWEMAKRGLGVASMLREVAERTAGMLKLLPDMAPISVPIWIVTHRELQSSPRIRVVQKILAEELARM